MSDTINCANCGAAVIAEGRTARAFYEYTSLPFTVAGVPSPLANGRVVVCANCDRTLRQVNNLPPRGHGRA